MKNQLLKSIIKTFSLTFILSTSLYAQNSKAYTKAYFEEFNKTKDIFLAEEAGRRADKKAPDNELVAVFNVEKFKGLKQIKFGNNKAKCTDNAKFNSLVVSDVNSALVALCALKVNDDYVLYQGYSTVKSKRIEFSTNSALIPSSVIPWWFNHFNLSSSSKKYLLNK